MENSKLKKIIEAARLYYQLDYSQQDIAKILGVSRPTISRFLQLAKEEGIVQIKILDPSEDNESIGAQLAAKFQLKKAVIVSVPQYEEHIVKDQLGKATAQYLNQTIKDGDTIAVTWGTTLYSVAIHLQNKHVKNVTVLQLNGGVSYSEANTYATEIIQLFGKAFNTNPHYLPLPAIVDHVVVKQAIEADRHIRKVLEMGAKADVAVFTVGVPNSESVVIQANYLSQEDLEIIHSSAVGDICSRYIDVDGRICHESLNSRTIGIQLDELSKKEQSILVAGGPQKVDAIYGALRGKYPNVLITDHFTAKSLLEKA